MGFHVDYGNLDQLYFQISGDSNHWNDSLKAIYQSAVGLSGSQNMEGVGAESIRLYMEVVHGSLLSAISRLIAAHNHHCLLYVRDYQSNVDPALHAVMDEDELKEIEKIISIEKQYADQTNDSVSHVVGSISDVLPLNVPSYGSVDRGMYSISSDISVLIQKVQQLENSHAACDFTETGALISSLTSFISSRMQGGRAYIENTSLQTISGNAAFQKLCMAYVAVDRNLQANSTSISQALKEENLRIEGLRAESEEMQKRAKAATFEKLAVAGACVVLSGLAIAATGGAAAPLVIASVSAVSGAVISGNNAAADQYVSGGEITDLGAIGEQAMIGGVAGFLTGYIGGGLQNFVTSGLSNVAPGLMNSQSTLVRIGSHAVVGAASEVVAGVGSRGTSVFFTGMVTSEGDLKNSLDKAGNAAFDLKQIMFDAAIGGVAGGIEGAKTEPDIDIPDDKNIPKTEADKNLDWDNAMSKAEIEAQIPEGHRTIITDHEERINAVMEDMSGTPISREEADYIQQAMEDYTSDSTNIRKSYNHPESDYHKQMEALDKYIHASPKWEGEVKRGVNVTPEVAKGFLTNDSIDMRGTSSWTTSEKTAKNFACDAFGNENNEKVVFVLGENKSGTSVTHLSHFGRGEQEVLAPSNVQYIRDSHKRVKDGVNEYLYIYVHEAP